MIATSFGNLRNSCGESILVYRFDNPLLFNVFGYIISNSQYEPGILQTIFIFGNHCNHCNADTVKFVEL